MEVFEVSTEKTTIEEIEMHYRRGMLTEAEYDVFKAADDMHLDIDNDVFICCGEYMISCTDRGISASGRDPYAVIEKAKRQNSFFNISRTYTLGGISRNVLGFYADLYELGYPIYALNIQDAMVVCGEI